MKKIALLLLNFIICYFGFTQRLRTKPNSTVPKDKIILTYEIADSIKPNQVLFEIAKTDLLIDQLRCLFFVGNSVTSTVFSSEHGMVVGVEHLGETKDPFAPLQNASTIVTAKGLNTTENGGKISFDYGFLKDTGAIKVLVNMLVDSINKARIFTSYVFLPDIKMWKLIGSIKAIQKNSIEQDSLNYLAISFYPTMDLYSSLKILIGNTWIQTQNGNWKELTSFNLSSNIQSLTVDQTSNKTLIIAEPLKGVSKTKREYQTTPTNQRPILDVTKNVDSAEQYTIDIKTINNAIATKKIDTTGSINDVYYKILKAGTGANVLPTDTVTCYYKGSLLSDGSLFDSTKANKPAIFPLKRLIKGWAIGLSMCKVGGKIRLFIPSALGYSIRSRSKAIPPNSILVFDIEVLGVKSEK